MTKIPWDKMNARITSGDDQALTELVNMLEPMSSDGLHDLNKRLAAEDDFELSVFALYGFGKVMDALAERRTT